MITLEKLLNELKAESLNEIVAGGHSKKHHKKKHKKGKHGHGGGTSGTHTNMTGMTMTTAHTMSGTTHD
jgi:hypothetical protein